MIRATAVYFALVFGLGFVLGPIRELFLAPRVGARNAELIEFPIMFVALTLAAMWITHQHRPSIGHNQWLIVGFSAALTVLIADLAVGVFLRGMTVLEVFTNRDSLTGTIYYGLILLYAVMPWLFAWHCGRFDSHPTIGLGSSRTDE